MTKITDYVVGRANPAIAEAVQLMLDSGRWKVDAEAGIVYGVRGKPIGRTVNGYGYNQVQCEVGGKKYRPPTHRVIWQAVHGPITDPRLEINHINGIKTDNRIENLELVTPGDNQRHAFATGLHKRIVGEASVLAKLSEAEVKRVLTLKRQGVRQAEICRRTGISPAQVSRIVNGKIWQHLQEAS